MTAHPTLIPTLRYRDAASAIAWLERAFGFKTQMLVDGEGGTIAHAQLTHTHGMIMVGTIADDEWQRAARIADPLAINATTQAVYVVVSNPDELCARAKREGAEILYGPRDTDYGSREFAARDPQGHVWSFGTYDPFA
ncbi:MAG: glyoxalase [Alphaproteobacteria bacterium]|nr:glyoxalase [Alphaproteobacteria bacterium]